MMPSVARRTHSAYAGCMQQAIASTASVPRHRDLFNVCS
jgi:hypothetical protein